MKVNDDISDEPVVTLTASPSTAESTRTAEARLAPKAEPERLSASEQSRERERYIIIGEHGRGGLGRVFRAHDLNLGRDVAIKELISRSSVSEIRFLREALITARLEHPGIVPVHEAGRRPDGTPFYAMKLVAGHPLRDLIAARSTVAERIGLLHHVIAVADAIAYAHGRNVIHRDLKPANVIVGDFGETIVIDWGLAKDLSGAEDCVIPAGPFRVNHSADLTSTGSVLGTPAYMAPEQERGEQVDQRADVFAIGAMLWELCSLQKVPPTDRRVRHRLLRRSGIDQDLITIIDKALAPQADLRYANAGALALDLKAFKSGARIMARQYSPWALLYHWIRRHVALATSAIAVLVVAAIASVYYVRGITVERDRADKQEDIARRERALAEDSLSQLTLKHAQLLLTKDPSSAVDTLASYHGSDVDRVNQIASEAKGQGVSLLRALPHTGMVRWVEALTNGSILSVGTDGTITQTSTRQISTTVLSDVARFAVLSYSRSRQLLAYACNPSDVCMYDALKNSRIALHPLLRDIHVGGMSFSTDGSLLAMMSQDGTLRVVDVKIPDQPRVLLTKNIRRGSDVVFFRDDMVVASTPDSIEFVQIGGKTSGFSIPGNSFWDTRLDGGLFAIATIQGQALLFRGPPMQLVARISLCQGPVVGLSFIPGKAGIAFGCRDGNIGIWDVGNGVAKVETHIEGYADLVKVDASGEYIVAAGGDGAVVVIDLKTGLSTRYRGHESRVTAIATASDVGLFVSADMKGTLRTWPLPVRVASVAAKVSSQFNSEMFVKNEDVVIATSYLPVLTTFSPTSGVRSFGPHEPQNVSLAQSTHGNVFVSYGLTDLIEFWSTSEMKRTSIIDTKQGSLNQVSFVKSSDDIVASGRDGRLVRWTAAGKGTLLASIGQPVEAFAIVPLDGAHAHQTVVFSSLDGAVWRTGAEGKVSLIRAAAGARFSCMTLLEERGIILAGTTKGEVIAIDAKSWAHSIIFKIPDAVRQISAAPDGRWIVVGTNDGEIYTGTTTADHSFDLYAAVWRTLAIRARRHSLTVDGLIVAVCNNGLIWIYSVTDQQWLSLPVDSADFRWVATSSTGGAASALDVGGRLVWIDLAMARKLIPHRT